MKLRAITEQKYEISFALIGIFFAAANIFFILWSFEFVSNSISEAIAPPSSGGVIEGFNLVEYRRLFQE